MKAMSITETRSVNGGIRGYTWKCVCGRSFKDVYLGYWLIYDGKKALYAHRKLCWSRTLY